MYSGNPCYWRNHQIKFLDNNGANNIMVRSMSVIGNTVYSCGQKSDPLPEVACFWKNKELLRHGRRFFDNYLYYST